jgi:hypothetical protein
VRFCEVKAIDFVEESDLGLQKSRQAAQRIRTADTKAGGLQSG